MRGSNVNRPTCHCLDAAEAADRGPPTLPRWRELSLHDERQDTSSRAWQALVELVDRAAADGREVFEPAEELGWDTWWQIVTLPPTIAKLTRVKVLRLYGSGLVRVPPEIGEMAALEEFDPYTSYRLHYVPYELTRCSRLTESRVSTRALYGNYKYRPPFPRLDEGETVPLPPARCSVCGGAFGAGGPVRRWISLRVATDVLPLLVHACSGACVERLPQPPAGYGQSPHQGGLHVVQPPRRF